MATIAFLLAVVLAAIVAAFVYKAIPRVALRVHYPRQHPRIKAGLSLVGGLALMVFLFLVINPFAQVIGVGIKGVVAQQQPVPTATVAPTYTPAPTQVPPTVVPTTRAAQPTTGPTAPAAQATPGASAGAAPATPVPSGQQPIQGAVEFKLGCADKDVGAVQALIGLSVVCIGTEYDAYTWRSVPLKVDATVPEGWIATLHILHILEGTERHRVIVTESTGTYRDVVAGTFRRKAGYPANDPVHNACALLRKEQVFGASQTPSFLVYAHGFECNASPAGAVQQITQPTPVDTGGNYPTTTARVAQLVGGSAGSWRILPSSDNRGFKYEGASVTLTVPRGAVLDHPGGRATAGQQVTTTVATLWPA